MRWKISRFNFLLAAWLLVTRLRSISVGALLCVLLLAGPAVHAQSGDPYAEANDHFGTAVAHGDFNGDNYQDLAVGVPDEDRTNGPTQVADTGAVVVFYGTATGLASSGRQYWDQGSAGIADNPEAGDRFGASLAAGDFNDDGYDDLAIGAPGEDLGSTPIQNAGAVNVLYGSPAGLSVSAVVPDQIWHQNRADVAEVAEADDRFGWSLTTGDFNRDGYDDLAIGVIGETVGTVQGAGAVNVIYGSRLGLSATAALADQLWHQDSPQVEDQAEAGDWFGRTLAAGDFNGDGYDDLAIGVPDEAWNAHAPPVAKAGAVHVLHGSALGLSATERLVDQFWTQDSNGVDDDPEVGDFFGYSLAVVHLSGPDLSADLAIGVPFETVDGVQAAGAVHILFGSSIGLSPGPEFCRFWHQNRPNVQGTAGYADYFGYSLAGGDFDGDYWDDLAVGVPNEDVGSINAGAVHVISCSPFGVLPQFWHQNVADVENTSEAGDQFGYSLTAAKFNGGAYADLATGVPFEDLNGASGSIADTGAVSVLYGSSELLSATAIPDQLWAQSVTLPPQP
jgi:FG-GAP repeat